MNNTDPNQVGSMLAAVFSDRPLPVLDESIRQERRQRAMSGIQRTLAKPPTRRSVVQRIHWGETLAVVALAAGLAMLAGRLWPEAKRTSPIAAFTTLESKGQVLCDSDDGKSWTSCDPIEKVGVMGLRTLEQSHVVVETVAGVRLQLAPASTLLMNEANSLASRVTLTDGLVDVKVPPLGPNRLFSVLTPSATITVHGTAFSVEVKRNARHTSDTCVRLREGVVSVQAGSRDDKLVAPATWGCAAAPALNEAGSQGDSPVLGEGGKSESGQAATDVTRRPTSAVSTLAVETKLLQRALGAEQRKDLVGAERSLRQLLTRYPNSVVAPEARAALERIAAKRVEQRP